MSIGYTTQFHRRRPRRGTRAARPCGRGGLRRRSAQDRLHLPRTDRRLRLDLGARTRAGSRWTTRSKARSTDYVENVKEDASAIPILKDLAQQGNKLIFTTSYGYMDQTIEVAKQFPDVKFEHCTGYKHADNVGTYNSRFYQGRAVEGTIAGHHVEDRARSAISAPTRCPRS